MSKSNFKQGMSHEEALSHDLGYNGLVDDEARTNYLKSYTSLKDRPDYDLMPDRKSTRLNSSH